MRLITTPTLTLEPQTVAHAAAMFVLLSDPAIYAYGNSAPASLAWLQERFERLASRRSPDCRQRWLNWVIRLPDGDGAGNGAGNGAGEVAGNGADNGAGEVAGNAAGNAAGAVAGYVQATLDEHGQATVGYELGSAFWGRGLGTQAVAAMIDELGQHYRVTQLRATLHPDNQRSMRLLLRLGFVPVLPTADEIAAMDAGDCLMRRHIA